jgi:hypothetical protein
MSTHVECENSRLVQAGALRHIEYRTDAVALYLAIRSQRRLSFGQSGIQRLHPITHETPSHYVTYWVDRSQSLDDDDVITSMTVSLACYQLHCSVLNLCLEAVDH